MTEQRDALLVSKQVDEKRKPVLEVIRTWDAMNDSRVHSLSKSTFILWVTGLSDDGRLG